METNNLSGLEGGAPAVAVRLGGEEVPVGELLVSAERMKLYQADVSRRIEEVKLVRLREHWKMSSAWLRSAVLDALQVQADVIAQELQAVLREFERAQLEGGVLLGSSPPPPFVRDQSENAVSGLAALGLAALEQVAVEQADVEQADVEQADVEQADVEQVALVAPSPPAHEERVSLREKAARYQATIQDLSDTFDAILAVTEQLHEDNNIALSRALRVRSAFCGARSLSEHGDLPETMVARVDDLTETLASDRISPWGGGNAAFNHGYASRLTSDEWRSLYRLYAQASEGGELLEFFDDNMRYIEEDDTNTLLNVAAATQQVIFRQFKSVVQRDDALMEFYKHLRERAETHGYLWALSQAASTDDLEAAAGRVGDLKRRIVREAEEARSTEDRVAARENAIAAVLAWDESREGRGVTEDTLEADRSKLFTLLDECLRCGVPPFNVKVRAALLDVAPILLEGQARFAKVLEAIQAERGKRHLESVSVEVATPVIDDAEAERLAASVRDFTSGKRILIVGGKKRDRVSIELSAALHCDVGWAETERGDKAAKHASAIRKANIVLLLKNLASHEITVGVTQQVKSNGGHCLMLPSGYGVKQVLFQLNEYKERGARALA